MPKPATSVNVSAESYDFSPHRVNGHQAITNRGAVELRQQDEQDRKRDLRGPTKAAEASVLGASMLCAMGNRKRCVLKQLVLCLCLPRTYILDKVAVCADRTERRCIRVFGKWKG